MDSHQLFEMALNLGKEWSVTGCCFEGEPKKLKLNIEPKRGLQWKCPECGTKGSAHDLVEKRWRHLDFFQYECELAAKVPRCQCATHGVRLVEVPWARPGRGFTLMFEALVMLLCQQMPVAEVAELLKVQDTRLWRVVCAHVEKAQAGRDWSKVERILIDETSAKRGHRYVTNFVDAQSRELLLMVAGRKAEAVGEFVEALKVHGGDPAQIKWVGLDMSGAYKAGVEKYLPNAERSFDHFHIMQLAGNALDEVRRKVQGDCSDLKGARWTILGNESNKSDEELELRRVIASAYPKLGRAMGFASCCRTCSPNATKKDYADGITGPAAANCSPSRNSRKPSSGTGTESSASSKAALPAPRLKQSTARSNSPNAWLAGSATSSSSAPFPTSKQPSFPSISHR